MTSTQTLPLLPLTNGVVLPSMVVTVGLETDEALAAADAALAGDRRLLLVPRLGDRYARVGVVASVEDVGRLPNGSRAIVVRGIERATLGAGVPGTGAALWIHAETAEESGNGHRARELAKEYRATVENILDARGARQIADAMREISEPGDLADTAGYSPDLDLGQKVQLLEQLDIERRLEVATAWMKEILADLSLKDRIRRDVTEGMEKQQREFLLRQQMAAIRKELGDEEGGSDYRAKLDETELPEAVRQKVEAEIARLERTPEQNPEQGWIRTWLDTVFGMPWGKRSTERIDVAEAREVLDADHHGLADPKDRIVEHLAVRKLRAERGIEDRKSGAILAFVGPPGVGKTSLGESIARATGRAFVRVALGGVRDEAEIRGHRRTYVGAMPGRIVRAISEAQTMNPVVLLDEVDKVGADWRGDPSSALLEVLDPAQNHTFRDHYLEVELDLSDVLFIATANVIETIPGPLLDRMEVVRLDGYTEDEKVAIARDHLLRRQLEAQGLTSADVTLSDEALHQIAADYTREAGVRNLEREIGRVLRKAATKVAAGVAVGTIDDVEPYLGRPKFWSEVAERTAVPGVATGLAVTGTGGDVLFVEASASDGEGLALTGQLGDVMRESAEIALSWVRSHAAQLGVELLGKRFHVHVPAGAVPKDGPSAGVTMTTALVSLLTGRAVKADVGMTGEVTLRGRVLPIGGVKQKVLAAHRAGLTTVLLPLRNGPDLDEVPQAVRDEMTFHLVSDIGQVLELALEESREGIRAA